MTIALADARPEPATVTGPPAELPAWVARGAYLPPADLPLDVWLGHGKLLARDWARLLWLISDWARFGVDYYGPAAWAHLATISGRTRDTLKKMVSVSRIFPPSRRRLTIPYSRHVAVMTLPDSEADRLLQRAEREGWTQNDLVRQIRVYRGQPTGRKRMHAKRSSPADRSPAMTLVYPRVDEHKEATPLRCSGCLLTIGYAMTRAVVSSGPAAIQRVATGQLVANLECTSCASTTPVSLGMLELPSAPGVAAVGAG